LEGRGRDYMLSYKDKRCSDFSDSTELIELKNCFRLFNHCEFEQGILIYGTKSTKESHVKEESYVRQA
jgi:hypothetical protein